MAKIDLSNLFLKRLEKESTSELKKKEEMRARIQSDIQEFLNSGGTINEITTGVQTLNAEEYDGKEYKNYCFGVKTK